MRLKPHRRLSKKRKPSDLAVDAYLARRQECVAVRNTNLAWQRAGAASATLTLGAYQAALEREEVAADIFAELTQRVGHLVEIGLACPLTYVPSSAEASA